MLRWEQDRNYRTTKQRKNGLIYKSAEIMNNTDAPVWLIWLLWCLGDNKWNMW